MAISLSMYTRRAFFLNFFQWVQLILCFTCLYTFFLQAEGKERDSVFQEEKELSPNEDLMQEHGVLNRLLLIYEEIEQRLKTGNDVPAEALLQAASIMKSFIEDHHERIEEEFIFPQLENRNILVDLIQTLREQHLVGRDITHYILMNGSQLNSEEERQEIIQRLHAFITMYRPHEAREDTVVFPTLREALTEKEYKELGEEIEEAEHTLFGEEDFDEIIEQVVAIEKLLGIYELSQFTPKSN
jgi:hemerythrin-like domain-containing protein